MEKFLRIDVNRANAVAEPVPERYRQVGGRSLIAKLLLDEVKPTCEPLGKHNKLIIATGLLAGAGLSSASRISVGGKSPLTGGIKESNSGGLSVDYLARLGIKAVIIEGSPKAWHLLHIKAEGCSFLPADQYLGLGTYDLCEALLKAYPKAAITCIGPAGEKQYLSAGICHTDVDGRPGRISARGGLGAVMGSKQIKAILIEGKGPVPLADAETFKALRKEYTKLVLEAPSSKVMREFGTVSMLQNVNIQGGLPTRNYSRGRFDHADDICAEALVARIKSRGGEGRITHQCMPGCVIGCSNVYPDEVGKAIVSPLEYETVGLMGSNLDISDFDVIARLDRICNDLGMDTIETGAALGVAMEAGILPFGDAAAVFQIMEEVKQGTVLGRLIASGAATTGKVLGVMNVPAAKGQAMAAYDPRAIKGTGTTYVTSSMGADHTAGNTTRFPVDHLNPNIQAELSLLMQKKVAVLDCTGLCLFTIGSAGNRLDLVLGLLNARYGWKLDMGWCDRMALETLREEYRFNELAGLNRAHYRLSEAFTERELPDTKSVYDVPDEDIDRLLNYE